jgi:hypothetical protein
MIGYKDCSLRNAQEDIMRELLSGQSAIQIVVSMDSIIGQQRYCFTVASALFVRQFFLSSCRP